jgi:M6 family metalloprotease-like protein
MGLVVVVVFGWGLSAAEPTGPGSAAPDLSEYRTVETAVTAAGTRPSGEAERQPGFLGVSVTDEGGKAVVAEVATGSPAAKSGLKPGDILRRAGGREIACADDLRALLQGRPAGETLPLATERDGKPLDVTAILAAPSRPMKVGARRAVLGVQLGVAPGGPGMVIQQVTPDSPAARAKLKVGEVILQVDGVALTSSDKLRDILAERKPDDTVTLTLSLADKAVEYKVKLDAEPGAGGFGGFGGGRGGGWDARGGGIGGGYWTRDVYRLAVICVEYPDVKHNPKIPTSAWQESFFSTSTYNKTSVSGQPVYGSLNDYYLEQSFGKLRVEGKVFEYVEVSKKRTDYATGNRSALLTEAIELLQKREGKDVLKDFDGINFIYAGDRVMTSRGSLYWPHRASIAHQGRRWPYFICPEGGARMGNISVYCHEFGHMLGLPDLYARPENPGSEGLGVWCAMSNQAGNGRPQHFCAWAKEKLGWVKPAVIDPSVKQKLILGPVEESPKECFKVLLRPDGSEYLLLENRSKQKGFDRSLPAEGLLIWRVVRNRPILEESHGVEGPSGPRMFLDKVPYPSTANDAFTPFTTPSSRSQLGGGPPVHITNIRRLADGRVTFHIGYEYQ